jgi:hypothetical protein
MFLAAPITPIRDSFPNAWNCELGFIRASEEAFVSACAFSSVWLGMVSSCPLWGVIRKDRTRRRER